MRVDWWTIALQTVNFAILVWLLNRFLYKPVLRMIDARRAEIDHQYADARAMEDKARSQLAQLESERAGIAAEREAALKSATEQAQEAAQARLAKADSDAKALLEATRKRLSAERQQALEQARHVAIELGSEFAQKLLAEVPVQVRAEAWLDRIDHYLRNMPANERDKLIHQLDSHAALVVVTATPLPQPTTQAWQKRLLEILGKGVAIRFESDAQLVAGAELRFPTAVLHFSWRNALAALRTKAETDGKPG